MKTQLPSIYRESRRRRAKNTLTPTGWMGAALIVAGLLLALRLALDPAPLP